MKPFDLPSRDALAANEAAMQGHAAASAANDLRSYLQRSVVLRSRALAEASRRSDPGTAMHRNGGAAPVLSSLDDVLAYLRGRSAPAGPRAVLVMADGPEIDATNEAIRIARAHCAEQRLCLLVDLARGPITVGSRLGMPRYPGLAELAAGRTSFDDVIHVDKESPLQVIVAGNGTTLEAKRDPERLASIFEALAEAYHIIVLHADREAAFHHQPILAGRLRAAIAVLGAGEGKSAARIAAELEGFGATVLVHEQSVERRWFSRRSA